MSNSSCILWIIYSSVLQQEKQTAPQHGGGFDQSEEIWRGGSGRSSKVLRKNSGCERRMNKNEVRVQKWQAGFYEADGNTEVFFSGMGLCEINNSERWTRCTRTETGFVLLRFQFPGLNRTRAQPTGESLGKCFPWQGGGFWHAAEHISDFSG